MKPTITRISEDLNNSFYNWFAGFKAGRNSRQGVFIKSRINLLEGSTPLGKNGGIRYRFLGLENWYEHRGWGHGIEGRYSMKLGNAEAQGHLNFLGIYDEDRERRSKPYTDGHRFFGRWIHRGKIGHVWDWNWEFSRLSDPRCTQPI